MLRHRAILVALALLILPASAEANHTGPNTGNDQIGGAQVLGAPDTSATDYTGDATTQASEPLAWNVANSGFCNNGAFDPLTGVDMGNTVWYRITGTGGPITLDTNGTDFDTVLAVYDFTTGDFLRCDDDSGLDTGADSELTFNSGSGEYLVQVGGFRDSGNANFVDFGNMRLAAWRPPGNDNRTAAPTTASGANVDAENIGATVEPGESTTCGSANFGQTVWFRFVGPEYGRAEFSAKGLDSVVSVYEGGNRLTCGDDSPSSTAGSASVVVEQGREYLIQVGGYGVGSAAVDGGFTYQATFTLDGDRDNDGVDRPADCRDMDPAINPRADEIPGNRVNEDCKNGNAPYPEVNLLAKLKGEAGRRYRVKELQVSGAKGTTVRVRCRGPKSNGKRRKCFRPFGQKVRKGGLLKIKRIRGKSLRPGSIVQVFATRPGYIGAYTAFKTRAFNNSVELPSRCINVGDKRLKLRRRCKSFG